MTQPVNEKFFFITNYDDISSSLIAFILNSHPDVHCSIDRNDDLLAPCQHMQHAVDAWIINRTNTEKTVNGNINQFTAYELQNKILLEKTRHPLRMASIVASPYLRVRLLMQAWLADYKTAEAAVIRLENQLQQLLSPQQHELIYRYRFNDIFKQLEASAKQKQVDLNIASNKLFIFALTKMITQDSADLPASCKKYLLENLVTNEFQMMNFIQSLSGTRLDFSHEYRLALSRQLKECSDYLEKIQQEPLDAWMDNLIEKYIELRLQTIYYPHVDKPLAAFYRELGYTFASQAQEKPLYSKLISIQLNSNRPAQLSIYFDNIEETADHPEQIEVLVNIDRDDLAMREMLLREMPRRKFTIKYITTERPQSFCDLWKPINHLLSITDPEAYFLLNISDEMLFATCGWDTILKKYVGFFPDHLFRLRASRNKIRNYFDRWECSFGQDAIPITTRKWVEVGGDWNPCFGPDSFQQLISFYLSKEGQFSNEHYLRELPIIEIRFHGDIPALGIDPQKAWRHNRDHISAMEICQSYKMQLEAKRRAICIKAHIMAAHLQIDKFTLADNKRKKIISLIDKNTNQVLASMSYDVSWFGITAINQLRKLRFYAYFGGGKEYPRSLRFGFTSYLRSKYQLFCVWHDALRGYRHSSRLLKFYRAYIVRTYQEPRVIISKASKMLSYCKQYLLA
jgi:hypothetical protein